jgi:hypothetical protein
MQIPCSPCHLRPVGKELPSPFCFNIPLGNLLPLATHVTCWCILDGELGTVQNRLLERGKKGKKRKKREFYSIVTGRSAGRLTGGGCKGKMEECGGWRGLHRRLHSHPGFPGGSPADGIGREYGL